MDAGEVVNAVALISYSEFKDMIPAEFLETTGGTKDLGRVSEFREKVGNEVVRLRAKHFPKPGNDFRREKRWRAWFDDIKYDSEKAIALIPNINDQRTDKFRSDQSDIEYYIIIYYRFHAALDDMSFADAVDDLVFGEVLRSRGKPVFAIDTRPNAPFIHPPYVSEIYVKQRLEKDATDSIWLNPHNHHSIKLSGRGDEERHLTAFMETKGRFVVCPVIGPSGAGKTRLISEWMKKYVAPFGAQDWDAGFVVSRDIEPWKKWKIERNTLLVIDYTFAYGDVVKQIAERARNNPDGHKVRLVVIDHVYPKELFSDNFWQNLYVSPAIEHGEEFVKERFDTLTIEPEGDQSRLLREIIVAVAKGGDKEFGIDDSEITEALAALYRMGSPDNPGAIRHPLFAALVGHALRASRDITDWNRQALIDYYFSADHRLPWKAWTKENDRRRAGLAVGAMVSAATLRRGLPLSRVKRKLPADPKAIIQYASRFVSAVPSEALKPFEPDLLGEAFTLRFLEEVENREVDDNKRWAWDIFIEMLTLSEGEFDTLEFARNFFETMVRLIRNLINDDQMADAVRNAWNLLDSFLKPENFLVGTVARQVISVVRAAAVRQCSSASHHQRAEQFADKINMSDIQAASLSALSYQATLNFLHVFEFWSLRSKIDDHDLSALKMICRNFQDRAGFNLTGLMLASSEGHLQVAKAMLLDKGVPVNQGTTDDGRTALILACWKGHTAIAALLLDKGALVNQGMTDNGRTALMAACQEGYTATATLLLHRGALVNQGTTDGLTALMAACQGGHTATAALLLDKGALVNQGTTNDGQTALTTACAKGHTTIAALLLDKGALVNQGTTDDGRTALMAACMNGHTATTALLLDKGALVNQGTTNDGQTALISACANGHTATAALLLDKGALVNQGMNDIGQTALMAACMNGHTATAALLLDKGALVNQGTTDDGRTALILTCWKGHTATAALLLDKGALVNQGTTHDGRTALMAACWNGHIETAALLLDKGALVNQGTTEDGRTALSISLELGHSEIVDLLLKSERG